ncbi:MAG: hypothetical protein MHM6MM_001389 [Cercozoa sp. M6MM]
MAGVFEEHARFPGERVIPNTSLPVDALALDERLRAVLKNDMGIREFFPTQARVVPAVLAAHWSQRDVCVCAPTGAGKTLGYALPVCQLLSDSATRRLRALILVPTKDLVAQVTEVVKPLAKPLGLRVGSATGSQSFLAEQQRIVGDVAASQGGASKVDILVATPGRLMDHLHSTPGFTLQHLRILVVDEADRLLQQRFQDFTFELRRHLQTQRRPSFEGDTLDAVRNYRLGASARKTENAPFHTLLFSATLTRDPAMLSQLRLTNPLFFSFGGGADFALPPGLKAVEVRVSAAQKALYLVSFLRVMSTSKVLVFCSNNENAHRLSLLLSAFSAEGVALPPVMEFSGQVTAAQRRAALDRFASDGGVLVASDAAGRGLDVPSLDVVVNYDAPRTPEIFVHRAGRTARAGNKGTVYTFGDARQLAKVSRFSEQIANFKIRSDKQLSKQLAELSQESQDALGRALERASRDVAAPPPTKKRKTATGNDSNNSN